MNEKAYYLQKHRHFYRAQDQYLFGYQNPCYSAIYLQNTFLSFQDPKTSFSLAAS